MRALRVALQVILGPPAVMAAAVSAVAALAAQAGRVSLRLDVLTHAAPVWLAVGVVTLLASLLFEGLLRRLVAGFALVGVVASGALIAPEFLRSTGPHAAADAPGQLKIVQFNVFADNTDPERILRWLDQENPDIVVIEENSRRFDAALRRHPHWRPACRRCEVMMLSRQGALWAEPARLRRGNETLAPLSRAGFQDARGVFEVIGVHNAWPIDSDQPMQEARLAEAIAATADRDRLIVVGDFNSTSWSFARRRWDKAFGIPRRERALATWPAAFHGGPRWTPIPILPIDHVYAGPGWATVSVRRGPRLSSDHYPVVLTLAPVARR
jgi:endonuclease/exonuclease/phosphatase (EEP) superfamily protein YafD